MIIYSNKFKLSSSIVVILALLFQVLNFYEDISKLIMLMGFIGIIFSKEKNENEKIANIRAKVLQLSFILLFTIFFSQLFIQIIDESHVISNSIIFTSLLLSIFVYLIVFYSIILSKKSEFFFEDTTLYENFRKYSLFYLIYSLVTLFVFVILLVI